LNTIGEEAGLASIQAKAIGLEIRQSPLFVTASRPNGVLVKAGFSQDAEEAIKSLRMT
jgi:hypothetical protein